MGTRLGDGTLTSGAEAVPPGPSDLSAGYGPESLTFHVSLNLIIGQECSPIVLAFCPIIALAISLTRKKAERRQMDDFTRYIIAVVFRLLALTQK